MVYVFTVTMVEATSLGVERTGMPVNSDKPSNFKYEVFALENIARSWWNNFSPKWYLAAFPPSEVNKEYGLTQNPGWN